MFFPISIPKILPFSLTFGLFRSNINVGETRFVLLENKNDTFLIYQKSLYQWKNFWIAVPSNMFCLPMKKFDEKITHEMKKQIEYLPFYDKTKHKYVSLHG